MKNWTIRIRLTVIYGSLVLLAGTALLAMTYVLVRHSLDGRLDSNSTTIAGVQGPEDATSGPSLTWQSGEQFRDDTLDSLLTQGGIALGAVGVVAVGFGWLVADRVLRPLHRITETARRVADSNLHERIALTGPRDEVKELADTFDSMLERLDRSFDSQRRFVANASHELRTPLAINRTLLEVAMRRPDAPPPVRDLAETLLAVNARHERLIDGLLTLARSEQGITVHNSVDLADIAQHVAEQNRQSGVEILTSLDPAPTWGDPILLERVIQNLVQNGIDYNITDGWLSITTTTRGETVELTVSNNGPVVPPYEIPGLFEPFRRLQDRVAAGRGTGLGLSIVRSVTRAHDGDVTARPHDGGGLTVTVALPLMREQHRPRPAWSTTPPTSDHGAVSASVGASPSDHLG
ncbi:sensor histidine kinase [Micromonospora deserti]|uniref:histidine kinase n=1 Tax=Micromonospora deserti TaxID=2070366 RepID=A0A2W2D9F2_9ACTN|nr:HAMP domain-containing sensor histidine kinase [Micromonospora deserti]PZG01995.1 two-component sensor histidine kinase [Micromonospora deserti]